jgi:flagellar basal body-associated protein FliL
MSENIDNISDAPDLDEGEPKKKNNKILWIIITVVAVLLLCCCLGYILSLVATYYFPEIMGEILFGNL